MLAMLMMIRQARAEIDSTFNSGRAVRMKRHVVLAGQLNYWLSIIFAGTKRSNERLSTSARKNWHGKICDVSSRRGAEMSCAADKAFTRMRGLAVGYPRDGMRGLSTGDAIIRR